MVGREAPDDLIDLASTLRVCPTVDACTALFGDAIAPFGFDTFSCGETDVADRELSVFTIIAWPDDVRAFYLSSDLLKQDPIIDTLRRRDQPFTWGDMRADRTLSKAGSKALQVLADFGLVEGLVVPFPHGNGRFGLVSMAGRKGPLSPQAKAFLGVISTILYHRARHLAPRLGFALPPLGLSQRQLECMQLVAAGLPDRAIGQKLGISTATAHEYVEAAKTKLKARTRAQAVAVAMELGLIL